MTPTSGVRWRWLLAGLFAAALLGSALAGLWLGWRSDAADMDTPTTWYLVGWLLYAGAGLLLVVRVPRNAVGWTLLSGGLVWLLGGVAGAYRTHGLLERPELPGLAWTSAAWDWSYLPGMVLVLLLLYLFPDGRLPSRRWRAGPALLVAAGLTVLSGLALQPGPLPNTPQVDNPLGVEGMAVTSDVLVGLGNLAFVVAALAAFASLVVRYRRASAVERQQIKWFAYAAGLLIVALGSAQVLQVLGASPGLLAAVRTGPMLLLPAAIAVAVMQWRLYDIDVVISRSLAYAALALFIGAVYTAVVVGLGTLIGARETVDVPLAIAATVLVAVAFAPMRSWAQRTADRLVYGRRDSPYEVLASFTPRVTSVRPEGGVLEEVAHVTAEAVGAARGEVWLRDGEWLRRVACWPGPNDHVPAAPIPSNGDGTLTVPGADRAYPVRAYGRLVGALAVRLPRGASLRGTDDMLLADLASAAWLVLDNVELIGELRASRQRLVAAQDAERARIERDLHDGAQQRLLELALTIGAARTQAAAGDAQAAVAGIDRAQEQLRDALDELRELARGIHPAILTTRGLAAALEALAERAPLPVQLDITGLQRLPAPVEATAYFVASEALANVIKHAHATQVHITAGVDDGLLRLVVVDDGRGGADPAAAGLRGLGDRVTTLDGRMAITSPPARGTRLEVELPCG